MFTPSNKEIMANDNFAKAEVGILNEYLSDGMADTLGGWSLLEIALIMTIWPGQAVAQWIAFLVIGIVTFPIPLIWKRRITHARLGYFKVSSKRGFTKMSPTGRRLVLSNSLWMILITMALGNIWIFSQHYSPTGYHHIIGQHDLPFFEGWFFTMPVGFSLSHLRRTWRPAGMVLIYLVSFVLIACAGYFDVFPSWFVAPLGIFLMAIGIRQLRCFLREYPLPEVADVQQ
jgi:hypothetical protein